MPQIEFNKLRVVANNSAKETSYSRCLGDSSFPLVFSITKHIKEILKVPFGNAR